MDRHTKLTVVELRNSDKQVVNELVYRWCRILTRHPKSRLDKLAGPSDTSVQNLRKVLIMDMVGAINPIRLASILKSDERRMSSIGLVRGCKINNTFVTLNSYLTRNMNTPHLKLVVIYQDEFYIVKTLELLKDYLKKTKCHVLLVVPRLDRQEVDILNLTSNCQIVRADFCVSRREIGPAPPEANSDSYQSYLNQIFFQIYKSSSDKIYGDLREDGLHLNPMKLTVTKKIKMENDNT